MKCCEACFLDSELRFFVDKDSSETGKCRICGSKNTKLLDASKLWDKFDPVCSIYEPSEEGQRLVNWLIKDWQVFQLDEARAQQLLVEILDDGERARHLFKPSALCLTDRLDTWNRLRAELLTENRFFPSTELDEVRFALLLENLTMKPEEIPQEWYRARIEEEGPIPKDKMGAPPAKKAAAGRANPAGIPYLYVGSTRETAITEVRPHPGETLSIAEFNLNVELQLIDLRDPRKLITPFKAESIEEIAGLRGDIDFLERLGAELTTPVLPNAASVDYIPSQYLCEFIKKSGKDGVVYASSVSKGVNLALFDPSLADPGKVSRVKVGKVAVEFESI